jgi:hypothetical protein
VAGYVAACLVLVLAGALPLQAWANGGTARLSRAAAGPYRVSVWTQPTPPRVGALDVSVTIMRPSGEVITDVAARMSAEVTVWWAIVRSGAASAQASDEKGRESV